MASASALIDSWYRSNEGKSYRVDKEKPLLREQKKTVGFCFNQYRNGELTGSRFSRGLEAKPVMFRSGPLVTECLTKGGKSKIRRAIQNSEVEFKCFMTVTFSPSLSRLDENGQIDQKWGKEKFKTFINTVKVTYDRKAKLTGNDADKIAYVWVAERQENGNIHFHVILNHRMPIAWLTKIWGQEKNSIDVKAIKNIDHAAGYLRKYISKGENSSIEGNRYGISHNLRETMKPVKIEISGRAPLQEIEEIIKSWKEEIESNGGKVLDFGFFIPKPERKKKYRGRDGKIRETKGVSKHLASALLHEVDEFYSEGPF